MKFSWRQNSPWYFECEGDNYRIEVVKGASERTSWCAVIHFENYTATLQSKKPYKTIMGARRASEIAVNKATGTNVRR